MRYLINMNDLEAKNREITHRRSSSSWFLVFFVQIANRRSLRHILVPITKHIGRRYKGIRTLNVLPSPTVLST